MAIASGWLLLDLLLLYAWSTMLHDKKEWSDFLRLLTSSANSEYGGPAWNSSSLRLQSCVLQDWLLNIPKQRLSSRIPTSLKPIRSLYGPSMTPQTQQISLRLGNIFYLSHMHDLQWSPKSMCQFQQSPHTVNFHCTTFQKEKTSLRTDATATVYELVDVWWRAQVLSTVKNIQYTIGCTGQVVSSSFWPSKLPFLDMPTRTVPATSLSFHCNPAQGTTKL